MRLAGLYVNDDDILTLGVQLRLVDLHATADKLEEAYVRDVRELALTDADCEAILRATEDTPADFADLRDILLAEYTWSSREGLAQP